VKFQAKHKHPESNRTRTCRTISGECKGVQGTQRNLREYRRINGNKGEYRIRQSLLKEVYISYEMLSKLDKVNMGSIAKHIGEQR
jgi:hypothetical protein